MNFSHFFNVFKLKVEYKLIIVSKLMGKLWVCFMYPINIFDKHYFLYRYTLITILEFNIVYLDKTNYSSKSIYFNNMILKEQFWKR